MNNKTVDSNSKSESIRLNFHDILNEQCQQVFATLKSAESTNFQKEWKRLRMRHQLSSVDDSHDHHNESRSSDEGSEFSLELNKVIQLSNSGRDSQFIRHNIGGSLNCVGNKAKNKTTLEFHTDSIVKENQNTLSNQSLNVEEFYKLQKITRYLMAENICYAKCQSKLKNLLQQIVIYIQNKLSNMCKDFTYYPYLDENLNNTPQHIQTKKQTFTLCQLEEKVEENYYQEMRSRYETQTQTEKICIFIKSTIEKLAESSSQFEKTKEKITELKVTNGILIKQQEKLLTYIEDRKSYTQKLKGKINDLKEQIKRGSLQPDRDQDKIIQDLKQAHEAIEILKQEVRLAEQTNKEGVKMMEEIKIIEENTDLKYRNRNDLILMIRALTIKVLKYEKQMNQNQSNNQKLKRNQSREKQCETENKKKRLLGQSIDKFLNKSANSRKKGSNPESNS